MNNCPIGFFDSGLGGLTCIPHLMEALPNERIIYFGDTARTPYGSKAVSTIRNFSYQIADFLIHNNVKMIVIACNTITSTCLTDLQEKYPNIPILGIIDPAAKKVAHLFTPENNIGIIGTKVTISHKTYINSILSYNSNLNLYDQSCPIFVPLIEEAIIENTIMDLSVKYYLDKFIYSNKIDTLILGCTHYPLIRKNIEKIYPELKIIDPSEEIISSIKQELQARNLLSDQPHFKNTFYASDLSENFINMIDSIFGNNKAKIAFKNFDLEELESAK